ncbi:hypothetical protein Tco_1549934 [Tanacetum coccineum]
MTPTLTAASPQGKKRKQSAEETSSPGKSLKVTIKQKPKTISIPPPSDDREGDEIRRRFKRWLKVKKMKIHMPVNNLILCLLNDDVDDFCTRLEPESHKENLKVVDDDDVVNVFDKKDDE